MESITGSGRDPMGPAEILSAAETFRCLAACFYEPRKEMFAEGRVLDALRDLLRPVSTEAASHAEMMAEAFDRYAEQELMVEYARLFVGPSELRAAPYGSVYLEPGRRVMGETTVRTLEFYRGAGLVLDEDFGELPDHIAVQLEFMYFLLHGEAACLGQKDAEGAARFAGLAEEFMGKYLGRWVGQFCEKVRAGTYNAFYQSLAGCLAAFAEVRIPAGRR